MIKGTLYGVGVGPGDPRLMTYLAVDTIQKCPVIAVPADGKENAVSYKIASGIVENLDEKECLNLTTPMTKDKAVLNAAYQTIQSSNSWNRGRMLPASRSEIRRFTVPIFISIGL